MPAAGSVPPAFADMGVDGTVAVGVGVMAAAAATAAACDD
jgi:hypothetical protein